MNNLKEFIHSNHIKMGILSRPPGSGKTALAKRELPGTPIFDVWYDSLDDFGRWINSHNGKTVIIDGGRMFSRNAIMIFTLLNCFDEFDGRILLLADEDPAKPICSRGFML